MNNSYLLSLHILEPYAKVAKEDKKIAFDLSEKENFYIFPEVIFYNETRLTSEKSEEFSTFRKPVKEFYISLGIFNLDIASVFVTIRKNKLQLLWKKPLGEGKFSSVIPSHLVVTSCPVLSYENGVLDIRVPVKTKNEDEAIFVGTLNQK